MTTGRANTVLVFGSGETANALISSIIARPIQTSCSDLISFIGPAQFSEKTKAHILETIVPLTSIIFHCLGISQTGFELSIVNMEAAAVKDIGLAVSGYSADVPVFLAIMSAALSCEIQEDIVSTGHIASTDGDIRMVKNIPQKLNAAVLSDKINRFAYPALDQDGSLEKLSPAEKEQLVTIISKYKSSIQTIAIQDVSDIIQVAFSKEQALLAGLKKGFFDGTVKSMPSGTNLEKLIEFFTKDNYETSWRVVEEKLHKKQTESTRNFLEAFTGFYIKQKSYPEKIGSRLFQLVASLPPAKRRLTIEQPLIPIETCIKLSQFAGKTAHEDVILLYKTIAGNIDTQTIPAENPDSIDTSSKNNNILELILSEINADHLARQIAQPVDSARAAYIMDTVTARSYDVFSKTITSFYIHLLRHTRTITEPVDIKAAGAEVFDLLDRTFSRKGGVRAAFSEARDATNGGMRSVLDDLTDQFKREQHEMHINSVLKLALDPLDWDSKVSLIKEILEQLRHILPQEVLSLPPEQFAANYEIIVRTYVNSFDQLKSVIRCL